MPRKSLGKKPKRKPGRPRKTGNSPADIREKAAITGELPHEFLLRVSRGGVVNGQLITLEMQLDAAKVAAPYFAPRLSSREIKALNINLNALSDAELQELADIRRRLAKYGGVDQLTHIPRDVQGDIRPATRGAIEDAIIADDDDGDSESD